MFNEAIVKKIEIQGTLTCMSFVNPIAKTHSLYWIEKWNEPLLWSGGSNHNNFSRCQF